MKNLKTLRQLNKSNEISQKELMDINGGSLPLGIYPITIKVSKWISGWFK